MGFLTPATLRVQNELIRAFPGIKFGIYNRRKISGTTIWSQHSWPNALDIFFTSYGDKSPEHQAQLDEVYAYLLFRQDALSIKVILWRSANHYDHIHIDCWPRGTGTPSLVRGGEDNLYRQRNNIVITQAQLLGEEESEMIGLSNRQLAATTRSLTMRL